MSFTTPDLMIPSLIDLSIWLPPTPASKAAMRRRSCRVLESIASVRTELLSLGKQRVSTISKAAAGWTLFRRACLNTTGYIRDAERSDFGTQSFSKRKGTASPSHQHEL